MSDPRTKYHVHDCPSCRYLGSYIHDALMRDPDSYEYLQVVGLSMLSGPYSALVPRVTWREPTHMDLYRCGRTYLRSGPEVEESTYGPALRKAADMDDARCSLYGER
jgi:hypothetical protein